MKWTTKEPKEGAFRTIKRFAFLPITIGKTTVWLETCFIKQQFLFHLNGQFLWSNKKFVKGKYA